MATQSKTKQGSAASPAKRRNAKAASAPSRRSGQGSNSTRGKAPASGQSARRQTASSTAKRAQPAKRAESAKRAQPAGPGNALGKAAGAAAALVAGAAAAGVAGRTALRRRTQRPKVLGMSMPRQLNTGKMDPRRLARNVDPKKVVKRVGDVAGQVEARSEDVRMFSAQVKRLSKKLS